MDPVSEARVVVGKFLRGCTCYELIKDSSKVVVFDVQIPVKLAYFALVEHDIKASPLWDTDAQQFVGMMTTTDFIHILRHHYKKNEAKSPSLDLSDLPIYKWRELVSSLRHDAPERTHQETHQRVALGPEDDLYMAGQQLRAHRSLHQIPIIDAEQKSVLSMMTHRRLLQFLCTHLREQRRLFDQPIIELKIGTFDNIKTVSEDTPLITVLNVMVEHGVSFVPVISAEGHVVNIYSRNDIMLLGKDTTGSMHLDLPISEVLRLQIGQGINGEVLQMCSCTDSLHAILEMFFVSKAHRLVCVDASRHCTGVISLSDMFTYFIDPLGSGSVDPASAVSSGSGVAQSSIGSGTGDLGSAAAAAPPVPPVVAHSQ